MHPLIKSLADKKDIELENTIQELSAKYWCTSNPYLREQVKLALDTYIVELTERRMAVWQKQQDEMDNALGNLINID
jgi:hypothetical protein